MTKREFLLNEFEDFCNRNPYFAHPDIKDVIYTDEQGNEQCISITDRYMKVFALNEIRTLKKEVAELELTIKTMLKVGKK